MQVSSDTAKAERVNLIEAAQNGEEAVTAQDAVPVATLVPIANIGQCKVGIWADRGLGEGRDFFEPICGEDLQLWGGRTLTAAFIDANAFSADTVFDGIVQRFW